jgi:hypothetical protein
VGIDMHAASGKAIDKIAQLLAQIGDRSVSVQEADQLTDRMSQLIWEVSEPTSQSEQPIDYSIHDAAHHQLYTP